MPAACRRRTATRISFGEPIRQIGRLWREEAERVVAPVVAQSALHEGAVLHEGVHRHQFDRSDAQAAQVVDHCRDAPMPANVPRSRGRISSRSMVSPRTCAS